MKNQKIAALILAVVFAISIGTSISLMPTVDAHDPPWKIPTFAYIEAVPNPIGVGQSTHIFMWIDKILSSSAIANDYRWHNYKLTITNPDGTTYVKTWDVCQDTTSSQGYDFTPTVAGNYTLKFEFPGQDVNAYSHVNGLYNNDTYLPSSATKVLVVQQDPIGNFPDTYPLPTEYWTRPIYGENPGWFTIASDWLGTGSPIMTTYGRYVPNGVGPVTSHIMWTKPLQSGGVVGGNNFITPGDTYFEGSAYISRYRNPIIAAGKLVYKGPLGFSSSNGAPTTCVDLRTGELLWSKPEVPALSFAYIYDTQQPNQHGVMQPVLCTSNFGMCFDLDTGTWLFNVTDVPSGIAALGPQGEVLRWVVSNCGNATNPDWYLAQWNSSRLFTTTGLSPSQSGVYNASLATRYDWNVSIPWLNVMGNQTETTVQFTNGTTLNVKGYNAQGNNPNSVNPSSQVYAFYGDCIIFRNGSLPGVGSFGSSYSTTSYTYFAVNINSSKGTLGSVRWWNTLPPPANLTSVLQGPADPSTGIFTESYRETSQWVGYSLATGQKVWGPTESQECLDYYGYFFPGLTEGQVMAPGKLFSAGMAGIVYCYDSATGDLLWTFGNGGVPGNNTNSGFQVPGPYPTFVYAVMNGVVYTMTTEHTVETPIYKDARVHALNATTGAEIWNLSNYNGGGTSACATADGFTTFYNGYDDQVYVIGKGPSKLTVEAPMADIALGQGLVIRGTVTDISAGTTQDEQAARFPNGVPAISDDNMTAWMEYVYQQKPKPIGVIGVPVSINVIDSNNNYRNIGQVTSDINGAYSLQWVPDIPGKYTVIASFGGSDAYWPSFQETSFGVDAAPQTSAPIQTPTSNAADLYLLPGIVAIIIAIAVVGAVLLAAIKKR